MGMNGGYDRHVDAGRLNGGWDGHPVSCAPRSQDRAARFAGHLPWPMAPPAALRRAGAPRQVCLMVSLWEILQQSRRTHPVRPRCTGACMPQLSDDCAAPEVGTVRRRAPTDPPSYRPQSSAGPS
jgi:hypothetical protein